MALCFQLTSVLAFQASPPARPLRFAHRSAATVSMGVVEVDETWTTTSSGLKYKDLEVGAGELPESGATVKVDYTGWIESSGKEFDSSVGRGPIAFSIGTGRVIPGWDEGVMSMKVGGKRVLSIPSDLAYGEAGAGDAIPPNSQLQFECKLVAIETGFSAFASTFPGGVPNLILFSLLALSFIPYFLPPDVVPAFWGGGQ